MVRNEFTFLSADGKTPIHAVEWLPDGPVRAVLQISHGVAEYILRYEPFAAYLTERGFAVVGHDHLGHGASVAEGAPRLYFGPKGSWDWVVEDLYTRRCLAGKRFPGVPYFLLGHSMGSFLARTYLIRYPGTVKAAILMGTGWQSGATLTGGLALAGALKRKNPAATNDMVTSLAFGAYNKTFKPNRTAYDWLSVDEENVDAYIADPLCGHDATVGLFYEMLKGIRFNQRFSHLDKMDGKIPILLISGQDDPVGGMGSGVRQTYNEFKRSGVTDCTLKLYPGLRHELLNEKAQRPMIYQDIWNWMEARLG